MSEHGPAGTDPHEWAAFCAAAASRAERDVRWDRASASGVDFVALVLAAIEVPAPEGGTLVGEQYGAGWLAGAGLQVEELLEAARGGAVDVDRWVRRHRTVLDQLADRAARAPVAKRFGPDAFTSGWIAGARVEVDALDGERPLDVVEWASARRELLERRADRVDVDLAELMSDGIPQIPAPSVEAEEQFARLADQWDAEDRALLRSPEFVRAVREQTGVRFARLPKRARLALTVAFAEAVEEADNAQRVMWPAMARSEHGREPLPAELATTGSFMAGSMAVLCHYATVAAVVLVGREHVRFGVDAYEVPDPSDLPRLPRPVLFLDYGSQLSRPDVPRIIVGESGRPPRLAGTLLVQRPDGLLAIPIVHANPSSERALSAAAALLLRNGEPLADVPRGVSVVEPARTDEPLRIERWLLTIDRERVSELMSMALVALEPAWDVLRRLDAGDLQLAPMRLSTKRAKLARRREELVPLVIETGDR